jgi:putative DNA primase/helicase
MTTEGPIDSPAGLPDPDPEGFQQALKAGWRDELEKQFSRGKGGTPASDRRNIVMILDQDPRWQRAIVLDEFGQRLWKRRAPPYQQAKTGEWEDVDDMRLRVWLAMEYRLEAKPADVQDALMWIADQHRENELAEYLEQCAARWDGRPRIEQWLTHYLGADALDDDDVQFARDTAEYYRRVGQKWLVAAVARVFEPGCRMDNMLILEGGEGLGKSTVFRTLGGKWFSDALIDPSNKDYNAIIQGKWIVEMPELESMNRADAATMRRFLTQHVDRYRTWYGTRAGDVGRRCVFAGSVNNDTYIKDESGGRRYWPVFVTQIDILALARDRDQLWGEAVRAYRDGVRWWEEAADIAIFREQQERRHAPDPFEHLVQGWVAEPEHAMLTEITTTAVMRDCLKIEPGRMTRNEEMRVGVALRRLGWGRLRKSIRGKRMYVYTRPPPG